MKKIKNYENVELDHMLRYSFDKKYGELTPLVIDILKRMAYEYGYTNEEMLKKASNLKENLLEIRFISGKDGGLRAGDLGTYYTEKRKIFINQTYINKMAEDAKNVIGSKRATNDFLADRIYEAITHELLHAANVKRTIRGYATGLLSIMNYRGEKSELSGEILNEIFNEAAASRLVRVGRDKEKNEPQYTFAYSGLSIFASLIATTCGVTDKEAFKAGIEGREKFYRVLESKFKSFKKHKFSNDFVDVEQELEILFENMASGDGRRREKYNQEAIANSLDRLLEKNMKLLKRSIDETNQDKRQGKVEKTYEEFAYRIDRATYISLKALKYYYSRLGAISTKQYQICERRAYERRIGLRQYVDSLDLPHDINKEYEKYILQEDLDDGKEWVLSKDIKEIVLSSAGLKEKTMIEKLQDFFSSTEDNNLKNVIDSSSQFVEEKGKENRGKKKKIDKDR